MNKLNILFPFYLVSLFFTNSFATEKLQPEFSTAGFYQLQNTGREVYSMNLAWRFYKGDIEGEPFTNNFDDSDWQVVSLPHGLEYLPVEASGCVNYQGIAWYRKRFVPDESLKEKKIFLHFEAIMGKSQVWLNGEPLTEHFGGYLPVIADIGEHLKFGEENIITVKADNSDDGAYPVGKPQDQLDFTYFGGIYRDCWLVTHNPIYITNANYEDEIAGGGVFVSYGKVSEKKATINLKTHIRNEALKSMSVNVIYELKEKNGKLVKREKQKINLKKDQAAYSIKGFEVDNPKLWSPESPYLYDLNIYVQDSQGQIIDGYRKRIGIRSIEFKQMQGLWINGKHYGKIMGTNRHQDFAVLGNALPNSIQWRDAKKLRDAGLKVIRTHYVIDPAFMDACDELGLFALVETPGWQFWNSDPIFEQRVYSDIRNMVRIHRNHPSLFFWEPVLNETSYPSYFAKNALDICKEEYPYPYSEVACDDEAEGYEHFSLLLRPTKNLKPDKTYFTREWGDNVDDWNAHNSNSRAAKNWGETPMLIQSTHYADRYGDVFNQSEQVVGGCFWHSFDHQRGYHPDPFFGGIMDAFRQPKTSYYMFMSQREPEKSNILAETGPMVYIAHEMTPFSPSNVTVFSNCDEVRLTVFENGKQYTYKRDNEKRRIPSPIITFENVFDFMACKQLARANKHNECYMLAEGLMDGKVVATFKRSPAERPDHIRLRLDDEGVSLLANGSDIVTVIAEIVDKNGTVKRLNNDMVIFSIEGEGRLIGDASIGANPSPISWGSAPVLVQSTTTPGKIKITASILYQGINRPVDGELIFESVLNNQKELYLDKELQRIKTSSVELSIDNNRKKTDLEKENDQLRRELNNLKLKEVEKQQTKFGVGIND